MGARGLVDFFFGVLCLTLVICTGHAYLSCYRCFPSEPGANCTNTNITQLPQMACTVGESHMDHYGSAMEKQLLSRDSNNYTAFCYSYYYKDIHDPIKMGIYRGCYFASTASVCQELTAEFLQSPNLNGTVVDCHVCNTNNCNTHHVSGSTIVRAYSSLALAFLMMTIVMF